MSNSVTIPIGLGGSLAPSENLLGKHVLAGLLYGEYVRLEFVA